MIRPSGSTISKRAQSSVPAVEALEAGESASGDAYWRVLVQVLQFAGIAWCFDEYFFHISNTKGPSMMPTFNEHGDVILVDKASVLWNPIHRNDVVIADSVLKPEMTVCKRVLGMPGDVVTPFGWSEGVLVRLNPPKPRQRRRCIVRALQACSHCVQVPPGHVWLEGDNPMDSSDSRYYGPVPMELVRGRVLAKIWPLPEMRWIHRSTPQPTHNETYYAAMLADPTLCGRAEIARKRVAEAARAAELARAQASMAVPAAAPAQSPIMSLA